MQDFDLETLFFDENGFVNVESLEAYIGSYKLKPNLLIKPEKHLEENKHNYALYASLPNEALRLCSASDSFNKDLNRMSWGNNFNDNGCLMTIGNEYGYQTVTHPLSSAIIDRHLGPAGIMVFPLLQGFFPLLRAN